MRVGSCYVYFPSQLAHAMGIKEQAIKRLRQRVAYWTNRLSMRPRAVRIVPMKRKWGSCSSSGIVTLAADLTMHEERVQDVVIVHELLHLRVQNHGKLFRALMNIYVPQWRKLTSHSSDH